MKVRFNNFDIVCGVTELQSLTGLRVNQIYDIDNKTFLIRFQGGDGKTTLLIESGIRFHTTSFEWPKNNSPSGFTMKLRKHLKNKRLEKLEQLGADRIIQLTFGMGEAAYHVVLELYDRGNIILTDFENTILYILRPHQEGEDLRLVVREKYPENRAKNQSSLPNEESINELLNSKKYTNVKSLLMSILDCGPSVIDHVLKVNGIEFCTLKTEEGTEDLNKGKSKGSKKKKDVQAKNARSFELEKDLPNLMKAILDADEILKQGKSSVSKGYIIQKREQKASKDSETVEYFYHNIEYHPYLFDQHKDMFYATFDTFMMAVDEFYSSLEAQKIDLKTLQLERDALKKLSNVKSDHEKRLDSLAKAQENDKLKADMITSNLSLVDSAINAIRKLVANQMPWANIQIAVKTAQENGDPIASVIKRLKLESNIISLSLKNNMKEESGSDDESDSETSDNDSEDKYMIVDVDINCTAWANARKYFDAKRFAAQKEQKTIDASGKALKSAERKTQQTLKEVRTISNIAKARKVFWFEKFYWFISSENYLVIGGRDAQQNELIVKRYMRPTDIYVHAEIQGASSVVIRNPTGGEVPPKTLVEAGTMAISYSVAWDAKVVTNAYWVRSDQVSKTAPSGEYLGTGSFMIRGKKNFLPPCQLVMGVSMLFKLEDSFIEKHRGERRVRTLDDVVENKSETSPSKNIQKENSPSLSSMTENFRISPKKEIKESSSSEPVLDFPDTEIKIEHDTGRVTLLHQDSLSANETNDVDVIEKKSTDTLTEETTIITAVPVKKKQQVIKKKKDSKDKHNKNKTAQHFPDDNKTDDNDSQSKRGQKAKQKRKNNKYKDQDREERELRMQILKSSGKLEAPGADEGGSLEQSATLTQIAQEKTFNAKKHQNKEDNEEPDELPLAADLEMLDALTGQPFEDDELIYVIPVVAPYQALQNYKYKVKIIPGSGKRGGAAKTALSLFAKDKSCNNREKDLFKSIKDEALARNIPGKVKLMGPQLQKHKH